MDRQSIQSVERATVADADGHAHTHTDRRARQTETTHPSATCSAHPPFQASTLVPTRSRVHTEQKPQLPPQLLKLDKSDAFTGQSDDQFAKFGAQLPGLLMCSDVKDGDTPDSGCWDPQQLELFAENPDTAKRTIVAEGALTTMVTIGCLDFGQNGHCDDPATNPCDQ